MNKLKQYFAHRLVAQAFLPNPENKPVVDHIDGDTMNNYIGNLRWATSEENARNTKKYRNNTSGVTGVKRHPNGRFTSIITYNDDKGVRRTKRVYGFTNIEEAELAYLELKEELHKTMSGPQKKRLEKLRKKFN